MKHIRYTVRKEYFGGLMYDKYADAYIPINKEFYETLKKIRDLQDDTFLLDKHRALLLREGILTPSGISYRIVEQKTIGSNLSAPVRIHFCYTNECNMNCKHCFTKLQNLNSPEMTLSEKVEMLDQMEELGISEVLVGGGEPLYKKNEFLAFIDECNKRDINIKIFTNGLLLTPEMIKELAKKRIKYISVSIDGTNEEEYAETRGVRALEQVINNVRTAKEKFSFPVAMSVTVNGYNYKNAQGYLEVAARANVDRIKIRPTKPSGNVLINPEVYLSPEQYLDFLKDAQNIWNTHYKDKMKLDFSWGDTRIKYNSDSKALEVLNNPFPYLGFGCFAGKGSMVIRANGDVSPCGFLPEGMQIYKSDNICKKTIKELWDHGRRFASLRELDGNEKCFACKYYDVCRGGCIARILYDKKKITDPDPWCLADYFPAKLEGNIKNEY